ncbi:hypothetical protein [Haloechinothrix alba]|nr:hypothetical protein [Haloechinothrix alba]
MVSITLLLFVGPLTVAVIGYSTGETGIASYSLALALIGAQIWWLGYHAWFRDYPQGVDELTAYTTDNGVPGLIIPVSNDAPRRTLLLTASLAGLLAAGAAHAAVQDHESTYVWGALAVYFALFPVLLTRSKFLRSYLVVTREGVCHRGWTFRSFLPWSSIQMIFAAYNRIPYIVVFGYEDAQWERRQLMKVWRHDKPTKFRRSDGKRRIPGILIQSKMLSADPAIVLALLGFYLEHRHARDEIASGAALARARAGDFR